jgi:hypothetical protein
MHPVFNVSQLKPYHSNTFTDCPNPLVITTSDKGPQRTPISSVEGQCYCKGIVQYLVHWSGHSTDNQTWVNASNLENIHQLIVDFNHRLGDKALAGGRYTKFPPLRRGISLRGGARLNYGTYFFIYKNDIFSTNNDLNI